MRIVYMNRAEKNGGDTFLNGDFVRYDSAIYKREFYEYGFWAYDQGYPYHEPGFSCDLWITGEVRFDYLRKQWIKTLAYNYYNSEDDFFSNKVRDDYEHALNEKRFVTTRVLARKKGEIIFYEHYYNTPYHWLYTDSDRKMGERFESRMNKILPRLIKKYKRLDELEYKKAAA